VTPALAHEASEELRKVVTETGIENGMDETTANNRLAPRRTAI
jgi:hypothetical protein